MTQNATTRNEIPTFIPSIGDTQLFGILTEPTTEPNGLTVVILLGGIFNLSVNRNRLTVRIARKLAGLGYHVLRLDQHGVGESSGEITESRLDKPWVEDIEAAMAWLSTRGLEDIVLLGQCFGGRTCLAATPGIPGLKGIGLVSVPVLDYNTHAELAVVHRAHLPTKQIARKALSGSVVRKMFSARDRKRYLGVLRHKARLVARRKGTEGPVADDASPQFLGYLSGLVDRRVPVLLAYGTEDLGTDFQRARSGRLGRIIDGAGKLVEVHKFDHWAHGFPNLPVQDQTMDLVEEWLERVVAPGAKEAIASTHGA